MFWRKRTDRERWEDFQRESNRPVSMREYQSGPWPEEPKPPLVRKWKAFQETSIYTVLSIAGAIVTIVATIITFVQFF